MLAHFVGPQTNLEIGKVYEWPDAEAARMVERGYAIAVREVEIERAVGPAFRRKTKQ